MTTTSRKVDRLAIARLREVLILDLDTGIFTWAKPRGRVRLGSIAGTPGPFGSILIRVDGVLYQAHRLVWFYINGAWPPDEIDHIDGDRANNRPSNLRASTRSENMQNRAVGVLTGAFFCKDKKKWKSSIKLNGITKHLGYFTTPGEASDAYTAAKSVLHTYAPGLRK